jgi:4-hydroxy-2-oxoheptanedioate aldolase
MPLFPTQALKNATHPIANLWLTIPGSWTTEVLARVGYDTLTIDAQHGLAVDLGTILPMLQSMKDAQVLVRVPSLEAGYIGRMLDAGASGIICPLINTAEEAAQLVAACRYPPIGIRSFGPLRASMLAGDTYFEEANRSVLVMAMIETAAGLQNLEAIAQTPGLDGLYVGTWDLCLSAQLGPMGDFKNPVLLSTLDRIVAVCNANGLLAGVHCNDPHIAAQMIARGFGMVTPATDTFLLQTAARQNLAAFRQEVSDL